MRTIRQLSILVLIVVGCGCCQTVPRNERGGEPQWPTELEAFQYSYSPKVFGGVANLGLNRTGYVSYSYSSHPHTGSGGHTVVKTWHIPEQEAGQILDNLVSAGILELGMDGETTFPAHDFTLSSNGWQKMIRPARLPEAVWKQLLPLMMYAHPEMWQEDTQPGAPADADKPRR